MDGFIRSRRLCLLFFIGVVGVVPARAAPQLEISSLGYRIEQVAAVAGKARTYDVTARAGVANSRDLAQGVTAQLAGGTTGVVVLDGQVGFGDVGRTAFLHPAISLDTFKLRFTLPSSVSLWGLVQFFQSALDSLSWTVSCANCGVNRAPVANAGANQTVYLGQTVTLDGSASSDPDGQSLTFRWSMVSSPAGSGAVLSGATSVRPAFVADKEGSYVFKLIVNDGVIDSAPAAVTVTTRNSAPVARAGADRTATVGSRIRLDGAGSTDVDGDALTYEWTLLSRPTNSAAQLQDADPASPLAAFTIDKPGQYVAELVVHDGRQESAPDTAVISTVNSVPVADAGPDRSARVGAVVELSAAGSSDADGDALTYRWSLTTPVGSQAALTSGMGVTTGFSIDKPGTYIVQLVVNDGAVDSGADTAAISTINSVPVADAGISQIVDAGAVVTLDGGASRDADGDALGFTWSFASVPLGSAAQLSDAHAVRPSFVTDAPGMYVAQLLVNDGSANSEPVTVSITARDVASPPPPPPPPVPDTSAPAAPAVGAIRIARADGSRLQVDGAAGSVEAGAEVVVSNFTTGEMVRVSAALDGSFVSLIAAADDDPLLAVVRDAAGNESAPAAIGSKNGIELTLHTPLPDQALSGSSVWVSGTLRGPVNTGVTVNGQAVAVDFGPNGSSFGAQIELTAPEGAGETALPVPIEVTMRTPDGRSLRRTVTVRVRTFDVYTIEASPTDGPAPLRTNLDIVDNFGRGIARIDWDFEGDGFVDTSVDSSIDPQGWTYSHPGVHFATARITAADGSVHTASLPIYVHDRTEFAARVQAVWTSMASSLTNGNLPVALARLNPSAQRRYSETFRALLPDMPRILSGLSSLHLTDAGSDFAEFAVAREIDGVQRAFFIYLVRDADGVWRVAGM